METLLKEIGLALCDIRRQKPLIHEITNYVTATDCANITLALGAKPIMATRPVEAKDVITRAKGAVLNLGTLDDERLKVMEKVAAIGTDHGVPLYLIRSVRAVWKAVPMPPENCLKRDEWP